MRFEYCKIPTRLVTALCHAVALLLAWIIEILFIFMPRQKQQWSLFNRQDFFLEYEVQTDEEIKYIRIQDYNILLDAARL